MTIYDRIKFLREKNKMSQQELAEKVGYKTASAVNKIELGLRDITQKKIMLFAKALGTTPSYLMGWEEESSKLKNPTITADTVSLPVIGNIAAGYDEIAIEDWSGETVEVPASYLKGRNRNEFIVLKVHGDSMFPEYHNGDKVVILKQTALPRSGAVGAVLYEGDSATLKKVEYFNNTIKLIPLNPTFPPKTITGPDCEQVHIIGIPKILIREIEE